MALLTLTTVSTVAKIPEKATVRIKASQPLIRYPCDRNTTTETSSSTIPNRVISQVMFQAVGLSAGSASNICTAKKKLAEGALL
jgi:hypothetical protein